MMNRLNTPRARPFQIAGGLAGLLLSASAVAGVAQVSVNSPSLSEGNSGTTNMPFTVTRTGDTSTQLILNYQTQDGITNPATAPGDYTATSGSLTIPAGSTSGTINVPVIGDTTVEPDETFFLNLTGVTVAGPASSFAAVTSFAAGTRPHSVASGDFNGDGKADLAVANSGSNDVSILLGIGTGTFGSATNLATGSFPGAVAIGDFNGDGKPDLVVVNESSNNVSILLGTGAGTFGAATNFAVGSTPTSVAIGDFNADGKPDLAVTVFDTDNVSILLGTGTGTFGTGISFAVGTHPVSVAIGDFNADGKPDLAVVNEGSNAVSILLGTGAGTFGSATSFAVGTNPTSVAIGDFNADGKRDLAVTNPGNNNVSILLGTGTGTLGAATNFAVGAVPESVAIGDFNGDGKPDLAVVNLSSDNVSILPGTGTGAFGTATNFAVRTIPLSVAVGDFNGDGKPDLAVPSIGNDNVSILLNTTPFSSSGTFGAATDFAVGTTPDSVAIGDFNGDGKLDLAVANPSSANVSLLLGTGTGTFGATANFAVGSYPRSVASGDFNGDGKSDLAVANRDSNNVSILLGTGAGALGAATNFAVGSFPFSVAIGDFNGDGKLDLAVTNYSSNNVSILPGTGTGTFGTATNFAVGSHPDSVASGDFNGDGKPDLAVANLSNANVSILLGDGTGTFGAATNFGAGIGPQSLAIGDFNGDGKPDLAVANSDSNNVSILLGSGTGTFGAATNFAVGNFPIFVAIGDFNRDGKPDLAVASYGSSSDNVSILPGTGTGTLGTATNYTAGLGPISVAIGDFNADGKPDLAVMSDNVSILLNQPDTATITTSPGTGTIINDDGIADTTPDAFTFTDQTNVQRNVVATSSSITVSGINASAPISVNTGGYSINGGAFTSTAGTVNSGDTVRVQHNTAGTDNTATNTTLTIGGVSDIFTSTTGDATPTAFTFTDQTSNVPRSSVRTSASITVAGITTPSPISVTGGEYSINISPFTAVAGTVSNGDSVQVRHTSSAAFSTATDTTLTIGGVSDTFTSITDAQDTTPAAFSFTDQSGAGVALSTQVISNTITISGINSPAAISIAGNNGQYSINGGAFTSAPGTVSSGDTVRLRQTSSAAEGAATSTTLTIGGVSDTWSVTTTGGVISITTGAGAWDPLSLLLLMLPGLARRVRRHGSSGAAILLLGLATVPPVYAADAGPYYFGARGGVTQSSIDSADMTSELQARGHNVQAQVDDQDTGYAVYAGYEYLPGWAVELAYIDLGKYKTTITGSSANPGQLEQDASDLQPQAGQGASLTARYTALDNGRFSIRPRIGFYYLSSRSEVQSTSGTPRIKNDVGGYDAGIAFEVKMVPNLFLGGGFELYRPFSNSLFLQYFAGIEYRL